MYSPSKIYIKKTATTVVTIKPITTGKRFHLAKSNGSTLQMAAAGIRAHGMIVPPVRELSQSLLSIEDYPSQDGDYLYHMDLKSSFIKEYNMV